MSQLKISPIIGRVRLAFELRDLAVLVDRLEQWKQPLDTHTPTARPEGVAMYLRARRLRTAGDVDFKPLDAL